MKTFQNLLALTLSLVALASCGISGQPGEGSSLDLQGEKGDKGDNGNSVLTGEGVPANSLGNDGDSYIDTTTFDFYTKSAGAWEKKGNIKGDKGNQGAPGEDGLDGKPGKNGENGTDGSSVLTGAGAPSDELGADGDFYVDTTAFDTYKKENGSWVKGGNIKGAMMRSAIFAHQASAVKTNNDGQIKQSRIMNNIIVSTLCKGAIYVAERHQPIFCHAARKGYSMPFGNAYVENAVGHGLHHNVH